MTSERKVKMKSMPYVQGYYDGREDARWIVVELEYSMMAPAGAALLIDNIKPTSDDYAKGFRAAMEKELAPYIR